MTDQGTNPIDLASIEDLVGDAVTVFDKLQELIRTIKVDRSIC